MMIRVHLAVTVDVDLTKWAAEYSMDETAAKVDARQYLPHLLSEGLWRQQQTGLTRGVTVVVTDPA